MLYQVLRPDLPQADQEWFLTEQGEKTFFIPVTFPLLKPIFKGTVEKPVWHGSMPCPMGDKLLSPIEAGIYPA